MSCKLNQNKQRIDEALSNVGLEDGKLMLWDKLEPMLGALDVLSSNLSPTSDLIQIEGNKEPGGTVRIRVNYPLEEATDESANPKVSKLSDILARDLEENVMTESGNIVRYLNEARNVLEKISGARMRKALAHLPYETQQELRNLANLVKDIPDEGQIKAMATYIAETRAITKQVLEAMDTLEGNDNFLISMELALLVQSFRPILGNMYEGLRSGPLHDILRDTLDDMGKVRAEYIKKAKEYGVDALMVKLSSSIETQDRQFNEEKARLLSLIQNNPRSRGHFKKKLKQLESEYVTNRITRQRVEDTLLGLEGDISRWVNLLRATHAIPDLVVGGATAIVKETIQETNRRFQEERRRRAIAYEKFSKGQLKDVQGEGQKITQVVKVFQERNGKLVELEEAHLMYEYDPMFETEQSAIIAAKRTGKTLEELRSNETIRNLSEGFTTIKQWERDFLMTKAYRPYTDYYYETDVLLDQEFEVEGVNVSLRELRSKSWEQVNLLKQDIRANGYLVTEEMAQEYKRLERERRAFFDPEGKPAIWESIAKAMKEYRDRRKQFAFYEVSEKGRKAFNDALAYQEKLAEKEGDPNIVARWLSLNAETTTSLEFQQEMGDIRKDISELQERLEALHGYKTEREDWERIIELTKPYYFDGEKDALEMSEERLGEINALYRKVSEVTSSDPRFVHLPEVDRRTHRRLVFELRSSEFGTEEYEMAKTSLESWEANNARTLSDQEQEVWLELKEKFKEAGELQFTAPTAAYHEAYDQAFLDFMSTTSKVPPTTFTAGEYTFRFDGKEFFREYLGSEIGVTQAEFDQAWSNTFMEQFKQTDWFMDNHIETTRWNGDTYKVVLEPTYPWVKKVPTNPKHILLSEPGSQYKDLVIRDIPATSTSPAIKVLEDGYEKDGLDIRRRSLPSKKWASQNQSSAYNSLNNEQKEYHAFLLENYLEDQKRYPTYKTMGRRLPAIEKDVNIVEMVFDAKRKGIGSTLNTLGQQIGRTIFTDAQDFDESYGNINRDYVPVFLRQDIPVSLQDYNLHEIFLRYAYESMKHKELTDTALPTIRAIEDVMGSEYVATQNYVDKNGISVNKEGSKNRLEFVQSMANMLIYGQYEVKSKGLDITKDTPILGNVKALEGKNVRWEKVFNTLKGVRAWGLMAFSALPQIPNYLNIFYNGAIDTMGHKGLINFTLKQFWQAWREVHVIHSIEYFRDMSQPSNKSKFTLMMEYFQAIPGDLVDNAGYEAEGNALRQLLSTDIFFVLKNSVEWVGAAAVFKAMAKNYMVDGVPIWEAFTVVDGKLEVRQGVNVTPDQIEDFTNRLRAAVWDINGNYAKVDQSIAETHWFGRAAFFMKKFVVPFFERRYGARQFSEAHGGYREGYHRYGFKTASELVSVSVRNFNLLKDPRIVSEFYDGLSPREVDSLRKFMAEMGLFLIISLAVAAVWDEDDEDRFKDLQKMNWVARTGIAGLVKTRKEVATFIFPFNIKETINMGQRSFQEIAPVITQVAKMAGHLDLDEDYFLERYKRDEGRNKKGDIKLWADITKLLGLMPTKYDTRESIESTERSQR